MEKNIKGQVISGDIGKIIIRQKSGKDIELGELLIADSGKNKILMQVYELAYGSQISQQNLELISGLKLENEDDVEFFDPDLRNYKLAFLKNIISISNDNSGICKSLPDFFSEVREVTAEDLNFITKPQNPLFIGKLRSGSKLLDFDVFLDGSKVLAHHILIPATTGRGKSNMASCILWDLMEKDYCAMLVLDPHDEYYGRTSLGLKDHPCNKIVYYTPKNPPPGQRSLIFNLSILRPYHFNGVVDWSLPQREAISLFYKKYKENWIESVILEKPLNTDFKEGTLGVVKRRLMRLLDLDFSGSQLYCNGVFKLNAGETTTNDILNELEQAKTVIIDTSSFAGAVEILIGSIISNELLSKYKKYKTLGSLENKPVVSIVLEEAPRVLGKEILERGQNIFSTIAREGRKFKIGLTAITQLPSLIPRQILANMNTKIILGLEMAPERQAIIDSASQDLSTDNRNIASLDCGEAIISSNFSPFAMPIKVPLFSEFIKKEQKTDIKREFPGINL